MWASPQGVDGELREVQSSWCRARHSCGQHFRDGCRDAPEEAKPRAGEGGPRGGVTEEKAEKLGPLEVQGGESFQRSA